MNELCRHCQQTVCTFVDQRRPSYRLTYLTFPVEEKDSRSAEGERNWHIVSDAQSVSSFDDGRRVVQEVRVRSRYTDKCFACRRCEQLSRSLVQSKGHRWRPIETPVSRVRNIQGREGKSKTLRCDQTNP